MQLHPHLIQLLAALRDLSLPTSFDVVAELAENREEAAEVRKLLAEYSSQHDDLYAHVDLAALLRTNEYHSFIDALNDESPAFALKVQTLLETKEYELRLAALKHRSLSEYVAELRLISEEELISAIQNGTVVNATDESGSPLPISSDEDFSATFIDAPTATAKVEAATLRRVLDAFSSAQGSLEFSAQGLRLRQVVILDGGLNLNWLRIPFPVGFQGCDFYAWISASYLQVPWLSFENCDFSPHQHRLRTNGGAINANNLEVEFGLRFWDCTGLGQLFIPDARIGSFSLSRNAVAVTEDTTIRTVIDGAHFGELIVPEVSDDSDASPFTISKGVSIDRVQGTAKALHQLLTTQDSSQEVWDEFADALARTGRPNDAVNLRIEYQRHKNSKRPWIARFVFWLFGDVSVGYFHKPFQVYRPLVAVFFITALLAFFFHSQLIKSPLANDPVPVGWLEEIGSRFAWSAMYALDSTFAPLSLGQIDTMWPSSAWLLLALAALKGLSLVFLGLFIGAATNLVSKKSNS